MMHLFIHANLWCEFHKFMNEGMFKRFLLITTDTPPIHYVGRVSFIEMI